MIAVPSLPEFVLTYGASAIVGLGVFYRRSQRMNADAISEVLIRVDLRPKKSRITY
ncbi:MAG: hypothetical protein U7126_28035 [Microcoleus sp.]